MTNAGRLLELHRAPRSPHVAQPAPATTPRPDPLDLLTPERVSELLKVPVSTVYALCREERIPHLRVGRRIVFERSSLGAWVRENLVQCRRAA